MKTMFKTLLFVRETSPGKIPCFEKSLRTLTALLLLVFFTVPLYSQNLAYLKSSYGPKNDQRDNKKLLKNVLAELEDEFKVYFNYDNDLLKEIYVNPETPELKSSELEKCLEAVLSPNKLKFKKISREVYVIQPENSFNHLNKLDMNTSTPAPTFKSSLQSLNSYLVNTSNTVDIVVTGRVTGEETDQLPGVSVVLKGTTIGTTTDVNGNYSISMPDGNGVLIFSYIGYLSQEVPVNNQSEINVILTPDIETLQEVVVVGYGTQKRGSLTGAVSSINTEVLAKRPVATTTKALQGLAPGLTVVDQGGLPGGETVNIRVRGVGNLIYPGPLYIVDGIPQDFSRIDPNDIENVTVLKDASAAAIYGSRAANGVILVTTKRGVLGKSSISYNGYVGVTNPTRLPERVPMKDYLELVNEAYVNAGQAPKFSDEYIQNTINPVDEDMRLRYPDTDHFKEIYEPAVQHSHSLAFSGGEAIGKKEFKYNVSLNYLNQGGMLITNSKMKRYSMRSNLDLKLNKMLSLGLDMNIIRTDRDYPSRQDDVFFRLIHDNPPNYVPKYPDGTYGAPASGQNALAYLESARATQLRNYYYANISAELRPFSGFRIKGILAPLTETVRQKANRDKVDFFDYWTKAPIASNVGRWGIISNDDRREERVEINMQAIAEYEKNFDRHHLKVMVGTERITQDFNWSRVYREGYYNNELDAVNAGDDATDIAEGSEETWRLGSVFGRLNYDFADKYLLEASFRYDGSSRFLQDYRWGFFPSFSGGWVVSEEGFMSNSTFIDHLKIRGSYGELGNQDIRNPLLPNTSSILFPGPPSELSAYLSSVNIGNSYSFGNNSVQGAWQRTLGIPDITWETARMWDIGLDLRLLKGSLGITADYYQKETSDILFSLPIPGVVGMPAPIQNSVTMDNKGWEIALNYSGSISDFKYSAQFMISDNKNKITDLKGTAPVLRNSNRTVWMEGEEVDAIYGYTTGGLITQADLDNGTPVLFPGSTKLGDVKYLDISGPDGKPDGLVTATYDRKVLASSQPHLPMSLNLNLTYKNFDLSGFFQGVLKQESILFGAYIEGPNWENYTHVAMLDRWTPNNPNASWPRLERSATKSQESSDFWIRDTKYVRLKNVTLGYNFASSLISKAGLQSARVYIGSDNLFTISPEDLLDPEFPSGGRVTYYPQTKTFFAGVNLKF